MIKSFKTRMFGTVTVGVSRKFLCLSSDVWIGMLVKHDDGWQFERVTAGERIGLRYGPQGWSAIKAPLWVALLMRAARERVWRGTRSWVLLESDTDCDGTTFWARKVKAWTYDGAIDQHTEHTHDVVTERRFRKLEAARFAEGYDSRFWDTNGYMSLGANWAPWVEDDTIGTVLDYTHDEPLYNDADIDQFNYSTGA